MKRLMFLADVTFTWDCCQKYK